MSARDGSPADLVRLISRIPEGWSRVRINGEPWAVTRTTRARGGVASIDAERLGGADSLGANVWFTSNGAQLRPCEVPTEKIWTMLRGYSEGES